MLMRVGEVNHVVWGVGLALGGGVWVVSRGVRRGDAGALRVARAAEGLAGMAWGRASSG